MRVILFFKLCKNSLMQLREREHLVLQQQMPVWYSYYQYSFVSRVSRFISLCFIANLFNCIALLSNYFNFNFNFNFVLQIVSSNNILILYTTLTFFLIILYILHCIFNVIIRIIFFKKIVKQNKISWKQCFITVFSICRYILGAFGLLIAIPGVDYYFQENGFIPPLKGVYMKGQINFFGANATNCCSMSEGEIITKQGPISNRIAALQEHTLTTEKIAHNAFNEAKNLNLIERTVYVSEALSNKNR